MDKIKFPSTLNGGLGDWIKFISQSLIVVSIPYFINFGIRVEKHITAVDIILQNMITRQELIEKLSLKADKEDVPSLEVIGALNDLKTNQSNMISDISQLRRDFINFMINKNLNRGA